MMSPLRGWFRSNHRRRYPARSLPRGGCNRRGLGLAPYDAPAPITRTVSRVTRPSPSSMPREPCRRTRNRRGTAPPSIRRTPGCTGETSTAACRRSWVATRIGCAFRTLRTSWAEITVAPSSLLTCATTSFCRCGYRRSVRIALNAGAASSFTSRTPVAPSAPESETSEGKTLTVAPGGAVTTLAMPSSHELRILDNSRSSASLRSSDVPGSLFAPCRKYTVPRENAVFCFPPPES